jgi:hypothetical protein
MSTRRGSDNPEPDRQLVEFSGPTTAIFERLPRYLEPSNSFDFRGGDGYNCLVNRRLPVVYSRWQYLIESLKHGIKGS